MTPAMRLISEVEVWTAKLDPSTDEHELALEDLTGLDELSGWDHTREDGVWVEQITAVPAGRGIGTRLLAMLCATADETGVVLLLNPGAQLEWDKGALEQDALEAWYGRHGFLWFDPYDCGDQEQARDGFHVMIRLPRAVEKRLAA